MKKWTTLTCRVCITLSFAFLAFLMLRCNCKKYRASFRLCLFRYCFCLKRSIVLLSPCAFLSELPMALHGAINVHLIFAHYLYRASCPTSIHRTFTPILYHFFTPWSTIYCKMWKFWKLHLYHPQRIIIFYTSHTSHPTRSCIFNNYGHYTLLMFTAYSLALNTQLATYAQKYENSTMLTHSLDHIHQAPSIF